MGAVLAENGLSTCIRNDAQQAHEVGELLAGNVVGRVRAVRDVDAHGDPNVSVTLGCTRS